MSKDYRHGLKARRTHEQHRRRQQEQFDVKRPSARHYDHQLRHAVRAQDYEAFEDYDEIPEAS